MERRYYLYRIILEFSIIYTHIERKERLPQSPARRPFRHALPAFSMLRTRAAEDGVACGATPDMMSSTYPPIILFSSSPSSSPDTSESSSSRPTCSWSWIVDSPREWGGAPGRRTSDEHEGVGGGVGFFESRWRTWGESEGYAFLSAESVSQMASGHQN